MLQKINSIPFIYIPLSTSIIVVNYPSSKLVRSYSCPLRRRVSLNILIRQGKFKFWICFDVLKQHLLVFCNNNYKTTISIVYETLHLLWNVLYHLYEQVNRIMFWICKFLYQLLDYMNWQIVRTKIMMVTQRELVMQLSYTTSDACYENFLPVKKESAFFR